MNYSQNIKVSASSEKVFKAITSQLNDWWGRTDNSVSKIGDEFTTKFGSAFWKFRVLEFIENEKLTWECIGGEPEFNAEWIGTKVFWEISKENEKAKIDFLHQGLTPEFKCYNICAPTWDMFIAQSLKSFVETGVGTPHLDN